MKHIIFRLHELKAEEASSSARNENTAQHFSIKT